MNRHDKSIAHYEKGESSKHCICANTFKSRLAKIKIFLFFLIVKCELYLSKYLFWNHDIYERIKSIFPVFFFLSLDDVFFSSTSSNFQLKNLEERFVILYLIDLIFHQETNFIAIFWILIQNKFLIILLLLSFTRAGNHRKLFLYFLKLSELKMGQWANIDFEFRDD